MPTFCLSWCVCVCVCVNLRIICITIVIQIMSLFILVHEMDYIPWSNSVGLVVLKASEMISVYFWKPMRPLFLPEGTVFEKLKQQLQELAQLVSLWQSVYHSPEMKQNIQRFTGLNNTHTHTHTQIYTHIHTHTNICYTKYHKIITQLQTLHINSTWTKLHQSYFSKNWFTIVTSSSASSLGSNASVVLCRS